MGSKYTVKELYKIAGMAATRIHNFREFVEMFGFFWWGRPKDFVGDSRIVFWFLGFR